MNIEIELNPPKIEDLDSYHEIFSDENTHHFIIDEGQQDIEGSKKKLETLIKISPEFKRVYSIANSHLAVGFIVIHLDKSETPFISYAIRKSYQKNGIASKAIAKLLELEKNNFKGLLAATHLDNIASQNLLKKCGFKEVGTKELKMGKRIVFEHFF